MGTRTLVIGDIHGAYRALRQGLDRSGLRLGDKLIFLGDYVDGWPESARVVDYLISLSSLHACIFIQGNHDVWCRSWLADNKAEVSWLENRGQSTILSYAQTDPRTKDRHLHFFSSLRDYYIDETNRLFIHAGFTSVKGPQEEKYPYHYNNDRTLLETAVALDKDLHPDSVFYPKRLKMFHEIFIGHTPTTKYEVEIPLHVANLWDVDTGAARDGKMSVLDIDSKEFWQSDKVSDLYKAGNG
jgi:serine/threonine protein phosphatase 1